MAQMANYIITGLTFSCGRQCRSLRPGGVEVGDLTA